MELTALGDHLSLCRSTQGTLFAMHCAAERVRAYASARLVTTLLLVTVVFVGVGSLVL
jgi:hypothetical protein